MGTLGDPYITANELKLYLNIDEDRQSYNQRLSDAVMSASREVEQFCGRQFNKADAVTTRTYSPTSRFWIGTDDFWSASDVLVEYGWRGGFTSALDTSYELMPYNGVVDGLPGWPYNKIRFYSPVLPYYGRRQQNGLVRVTAKWGWAEVPSSVKQATFLLAAQTFKLADAPFGVAGMDQTGGVVRVRDLPQVASKLNRFVSTPVMVG